MSDSNTSSLYAGAEAFQQLLRDIDNKTGADLSAFYLEHPDREGEDGREYVAIVSMVQSSLEETLRHPDPSHRQGYLRAMADMFCIQVDGCGVTFDGWDPIKTTSQAFEARPARG
jgi:hypothetical protein